MFVTVLVLYLKETIAAFDDVNEINFKQTYTLQEKYFPNTYYPNPK